MADSTVVITMMRIPMEVDRRTDGDGVILGVRVQVQMEDGRWEDRGQMNFLSTPVVVADGQMAVVDISLSILR